jgi:uncharacterized protein YceK
MKNTVLLILFVSLSACSSMFKDTSIKESIAINQPQELLAKKLYKQAKKCWATEYETITSAGDLLVEIVDSVILGGNGVKTKVVVASSNNLDGITIISYYQHIGLSHVPADEKHEYDYAGAEHPLIKVLITETSKTTSRVLISQNSPYENNYVKEVKAWLKGSTLCQK